MMSSVPRFVGELHVPGSSARTRHRGAFTIPTRCRDTRDRAGGSSPWRRGAETSRRQRPHVARPAKNPDRSMWRALMSSSFRFVCVGPRSTPARGLPHNSSSSHSQSPLGVGTLCGQRHDAGSRAALASPPQRAGAIFSVDVLAVSIFDEVVPRIRAEHGGFRLSGDLAPGAHLDDRMGPC